MHWCGEASPAPVARKERAWDLCRQYIDRRVSGVFFAPLELTPAKDEVNQRIARALDDARIPIILLDRTVVPYPQRGHHDLVGIDRLMRTLLELGHALPRDVRLIGIDDVEYASLLPVPLTTLRQPTAQIGAAALAAMLDRVSGADFPTRDILLHGTLIVRKSCGAPNAQSG